MPNTTTRADGMRRCSNCQSWLPITDFHSFYNSYKQSFCKECSANYTSRRESKLRSDFRRGVTPTDPVLRERFERMRRQVAVESVFCPSCETVRPETDFGICATKRNGRQTNCRECLRAYNKRRRGAA